MCAKKTKDPKSKKPPGVVKVAVLKFISFVRSERFHRLVGLFLLLFTLFLTVSFVSFFFTWKFDQSHLSESWWDFMANPEITVENWLGKLGALLSHAFIHAGFGIASFGLVLLFGLIALKILFDVWVLPIGKTISYLIVLFLIVPVSMAFFFSESHPSLAGAFGFHLNFWLTSALGTFGTGTLLLFTWLGLAMLAFNVAPKNLLEWFEKLTSKKERDSIAEAEPEDETELAHSVDEIEAEPVRAKKDIFDDLLYDDEVETDEEGSLEFAQSEESAPEEEIPEDDFEDADLPPELSAGDEELEDGELEVEVKATEAELSESEIEDRLKQMDDYDPKLDLSSYEFPRLDLLEKHSDGVIKVNKEELEANKNNIVQTLGHYKIGVSKIKA